MDAVSKWGRLVGEYREAAVPAPGVKAATLAQWMLESSCGTSHLALHHNNYAALPYADDLCGLASTVAWRRAGDEGGHCAFDSLGAFVQGYWLYIQQPRFAGWQRFESDPAGFLDFVADRGLSRDPFHAAKAKALLPEAQALLGPQDPASPCEPARRSRSSMGPLGFADLAAGLEPELRRAPDIRHVRYGRRPAGLEGALLRMDESPRAPLHGPDDPEWGALATLRRLAREGLCGVVVSRSGVVHVPADHDWESWGRHAGPARCPRTGRDGLSSRLVGIEINGPGLVYPTADPDVFVPWYNAVATTVSTPAGDAEVPALDRSGRARPIRRDWEVYRRADVRRDAPTRPGQPDVWRAPMTQAQKEALVRLLLHLKRLYPATFGFDLVLGQDEVVSDPQPGFTVVPLDGAGLAESMPRLRALLRQRWADEAML
jgi:hypothetical protein